MQVNPVTILDTASDGRYDRIVFRIRPGLKVVPRNPDDVREALIPLAKVLAVGATAIDAVRESHAGPISSLKRIQQYLDTVGSCHPNDRIYVPEISIVWRSEIVRAFWKRVREW